MELFDKVDEKDRVIGQTTKKQSHENGDIHRVVAIFVFTKNNKLYVQKRKDDGKFDHSVGGHVKKGETYTQAVKREGREELNLKGGFKKLATFLSESASDTDGKKIRHMFCLFECKPTNWKFSPTYEVKELSPEKLENIVAKMLKSPHKFKKGFINTMQKYLKAKKLEEKNPLFKKLLTFYE